MGQTVKTIKITFAITSDDKDWNSQVRGRIVLNRQDIATLFCRSADRKGDHWGGASGRWRPTVSVTFKPIITDSPGEGIP